MSEGQLETKLLHGTSGDLDLAAKLIREGKLVAFPTETVYGVGADATNPEAVKSIYRAKGRPPANPLIVHVPEAGEAARWAGGWPDDAAALAEAFWPGPLTLILPTGTGIALEALAGGDTIGLRCPRHELARELLKRCGVPVAAPSANRSSSLSPTTAEAVRGQLGGRIDAILDGGPCAVGIESTVLDLTGDGARILRPGMVSAEMIEEVLGKPVLQGPVAVGGHVRSPGLMPRHYAPAIPLRLVENVQSFGENVYYILLGEHPREMTRMRSLPRDPARYAADLYEALRRAESSGAKAIALQLPPHGPGWEAIHDRLQRAAHPEDEETD